MKWGLVEDGQKSKTSANIDWRLGQLIGFDFTNMGSSLAISFKYVVNFSLD